jgi:hypothetical protein
MGKSKFRFLSGVNYIPFNRYEKARKELFMRRALNSDEQDQRTAKFIGVHIDHLNHLTTNQPDQPTERDYNKILRALDYLNKIKY